MAEQEDNCMAGKTVAGPTNTTNDATRNPPGPSTLPGNIDLQTTLLTLNSQMSTMAEILKRCHTKPTGSLHSTREHRLQTTLLTLNSQMSTTAEILSQLCTNSSDWQDRKRSRPKRSHEAATSSSSADSDSSSANDSDDGKLA